MSNKNIYQVECFPDVYDRPKARKFFAKPRSNIAFYCDACGDVVYDYEVESFACYEVPGGMRICHACVDCMTVEEALKLLGFREMQQRPIWNNAVGM